MTKDQVMKGMGAYIAQKTKGKEFEWREHKRIEGATIVAESKTEHYEIREYWHNPEMLIKRNEGTNNSELILIYFADSEWCGEHIVYTGNFRVREMNVIGNDVRKMAAEAKLIIDFIEKKGAESE